MSTEYNVGWLKDNENQIFIPFTYAQAVKLDKDDTRLDTVLSETAETIKSHGDTISNIVSTNDSSKVKRAEVADKTQHPLKFGTKSFDGSEEKTITADDLGITKVLTYLGISTAEIKDGGTENPIIGGNPIKTEDIKEGSVVLYKQGNELYEYIYKEFIWNGSNWEELGDENSYAFKSVAIVGGEGLSGGGDLSETAITLNADVKNPIIIDDHKITLEKIFNSKSNPLGQATDVEIDNANTISIPHFEVDEYGRITSASSHTVKLNLKSIIDAIGSLNSSLNDTASDINESIRDLQGQIQSNDGDITELQKGLQKLDEDIQENIDDIIEVNTTQNDAINTLSADVSELHSRTKYLNARDEDGTFYIVDKDGNIIFKVDDNGTYSTDFTAALNVDGEITTITSLKTLDDTLKNTKIITDLTSNDTTTFSDINEEGEMTPGVRGVLSPKNGGTGNELGRIQVGQHQDEAIGECATSEGNDTVASGSYSHAEGYHSKASGHYSHTEGYLTVASGNYSHAEGYYTKTPGNNSHAEGNSTTASGNNSHAEGSGAEASGTNSHAEGSSTQALGNYSHAEGQRTIAPGESSHAEGCQTNAYGLRSHASGYRTVSTGENSASFGSNKSITINLSGSANSKDYIVDTNGEVIGSAAYTVFNGTVNNQGITSKITVPSSSSTYYSQSVSCTREYILQGGYTYHLTSNYNSNSTTSGSTAGSSRTIYIFNQKDGINYIDLDQTLYTSYNLNIYIKIPENETKYLVCYDGYNQYTSSRGYVNGQPVYYPYVQQTYYIIDNLRIDQCSSFDINLLQDGFLVGKPSDAKWSANKITHIDASTNKITLEKTLSNNTAITNQNYLCVLPGAMGKNSFVAGENSIAKGDNQFVIGQNNIPDEISAFIIGNGENSQSNAYQIDFEGNSIQSGTNTSSDFIIAGEENIILSEKLESLDNKDTELNDVISAIKDKSILVNLESNESSSYNTEEEYVSPGVNGILQPENGGTGNTTGRVQIGQKDGQTIGTNATSEGNDTVASGNYSHAEGSNTIAFGVTSHAEGSETEASGENSHAQNLGTIAQGNHQTAIGTYNIPDDKGLSAFIIGNGTGEDERSNAYTIDWDGNSIQVGTNTSTDFIIAEEEPISIKEQFNTINSTLETIIDNITIINDDISGTEGQDDNIVPRIYELENRTKYFNIEDEETNNDTLYITDGNGKIILEVNGNGVKSIDFMTEDGSLLPKSAGENHKLTGPLGLTEGIMYGTTLPTETFDGQLFFLEDDIFDIPQGGKAGQALVKKTDVDGDIEWQDVSVPAANASTSGIVTTDEQTFAGSKRFTNGLVLESYANDFQTIQIQKDINYGDTPTESIKTRINFEDKNGVAYGGIVHTINEDNENRTSIINYSPKADRNESTEYAQFYIDIKNDNTCIAGVTSGSGLANDIVFMGAAWNDYAEYRDQKENIEPGYCVASTDNGQVYKTTEKFQACDGIVSDTFGFAIGQTDNCQTPLAVAGRVLAYCYGDKNDYHAGDTVCAGPEGKVIKMTREEIKEYPDRIIGIVSEIPKYETWGKGNIKVNNRIWIKIK